MTSPDYADKVTKLLAKAERAGTPEEAEAFQEKAMQLMAKYGIDQAVLNAKKVAAGQVSEEIVKTRVTIMNPYSEPKARMVGWIAMRMRCRSILHPDPTGRSTGGVTVVGFESDVNRVKQLVESLLLQMTSLVGRQSDPWGCTPTRTWRKNWATGFAVSTSNRVEEFERRARQEAETTSDGPSTALVLVDRTTQLDRWYEDNFSHLKPAKPVSAGGDGYGTGVAAGRNADMDFGNRLGGQRTSISA